MTLATDTVLDRRRLARQLTRWRVLAIAAAVVAAIVLLARNSDVLGLSAQRQQIARITISGIITDDRAQTQMLRRLANAKHVAAVIVDINSPGGTTTGGEALFEGLRRIAEKKPVVAQFGTVAASAAYIAGLGTDHIVARGNTITGSVGVIVQWPEFSELLAKIGIKMNEIKSGPLKATPSPYQPLDERARKITEDMIADSQRWFLSLVETRRGIDPASVAGLVEGRVFSGRDAFRLKLVDELGGEAEAVRWLEQKRNIKTGLRIVDWKPKRDNDLPFGFSGASFGDWLTGGLLGALTERLRDGTVAGTLALDGMVSVWHPGKN
jgi:protease-4